MTSLIYSDVGERVYGVSARAVAAGSSLHFRHTLPIRCTRRCRSSASHVPRLRTVLTVRSSRRRSSADALPAQASERLSRLVAGLLSGARSHPAIDGARAGIGLRNSFAHQIACALLLKTKLHGKDFECLRQVTRPTRWRGRTQACLQAPQIGPSKWDGSGVATHDHSTIRRRRPERRCQTPLRHRAKPDGPAPRCGR